VAAHCGRAAAPPPPDPRAESRVILALTIEMSHGAPFSTVLLAIAVTTDAGGALAAELQPRTLLAWEAYVQRVEQRVESELTSGDPFLVLDRLPDAARRTAARQLEAGQVFMTRLPDADLLGPAPDVPDGLIHHWLGATRIPGARLDEVLAFVQRYDEHARYFDDVMASKLLRRDGDRFEVFLKLRRKKIVTVVYDTTHDVRYRRLGPARATSRSLTTRIAELEHPGEPGEREKPVGHDSGYLWRLNSYWRFLEGAGGVTIECESVSLSRDIPFGFGWLVRGIVEDVSRESLERTLASIRRGVGQARQASAPRRAARPRG
jgi:hypothetical protein